MKKVQKPEAGEYAPYAIMYIDLLPDDGLVLQHLRDNLQMFKDLVGSLSDEKLSTPVRQANGPSKKSYYTS